MMVVFVTVLFAFMNMIMFLTNKDKEQKFLKGVNLICSFVFLSVAFTQLIN